MLPACALRATRYPGEAMKRRCLQLGCASFKPWAERQRHSHPRGRTLACRMQGTGRGTAHRCAATLHCMPQGPAKLVPTASSTPTESGPSLATSDATKPGRQGKHSTVAPQEPQTMDRLVHWQPSPEPSFHLRFPCFISPRTDVLKFSEPPTMSEVMEGCPMVVRWVNISGNMTRLKGIVSAPPQAGPPAFPLPTQQAGIGLPSMCAELQLPPPCLRKPTVHCTSSSPHFSSTTTPCAGMAGCPSCIIQSACLHARTCARR